MTTETYAVIHLQRHADSIRKTITAFRRSGDYEQVNYWNVRLASITQAIELLTETNGTLADSSEETGDQP